MLSWAETIGEFVARLGELAHNTYQKLYPSPEESVLVQPTLAAPFCGMLADGVVGLLLMLNQINRSEANKAGLEEFDAIPIFTRELFFRLTSMGYANAFGPVSDPEAFREACWTARKKEQEEP